MSVGVKHDADILRSIDEKRRVFGAAVWNMPEDMRQEYLLLAPVLPRDSLAQAKVHPTRTDMLAILPTGGVVAEIGTQRGRFAKRILNVCRPRELHLIDLSFDLLEREPLAADIDAGRIVLHKGDSVETLGIFPEGHFDWVYVDADHTYDGVRRDLTAAFRVVRHGGFILCNDYTNWSCTEAMPYGVMRAVNEFCMSRDLTMVGLALDPYGYHDVALRKP